MLDVKVVEKTEQKLMSRTLIRGIVGFDAATPSRAEFRKKLSGDLKANEDTVAITSMSPVFGERKVNFEAHIYRSPKELNKFESVVTLTRHGLREKKAKAAKESKPAAKAK